MRYGVRHSFGFRDVRDWGGGGMEPLFINSSHLHGDRQRWRVKGFVKLRKSKVRSHRAQDTERVGEVTVSQRK